MSPVRGLSLTTPILRSAPARVPQRHGSSCNHHRRCALVARSLKRAREEQVPAQQQLLPSLQAAAVAVAAAAWLALGSSAAAEIQTVPLSQATQMAKPLQQQPVNKERVWLLLVLGGAALFGSTVVFENNATLFPAITKANKAIAAAKKSQKREEERGGAVDAAYEQATTQRLAAVEAEREWDAQAEAAVLAGLQQAKQAVLEEAPAPAAAATEESVAAEEPEAAEPAPAPAAAGAAPLAGEGAAAAVVESPYPPIIFEPGSIKPPGAVATRLQGMSDEQLEEALRRRQREMEQEAHRAQQAQQQQQQQ